MKRRGLPPATRPLKPDKILRLVRLRDQGGLNFTEIGRVMRMTNMGAKHLYTRWKSWADEQSA